MARVRTHGRADIGRPAPAWLIGRPTNGHAAKADQLEPTLVELADLVRLVKPFDDHIEIHSITPWSE